MFFSVKHAVRIAGKVYIPCVCYDMTKALELTIKDLADKGKARIHDKMVFFQNGKILESKSVVKENLTAEKQSKKKAKVLKAEEFVEEAEEIVTADEAEDF